MNGEETPLRRQRRQELIQQFLSEVGVPLGLIAQSTRECLDEWARQVLLLQDQPSANPANIILQLCRAVESEVASTLGESRELGFLSKGSALGEKAMRLSTLTKSDREALAERGINGGLLAEIQRLLSSLARIRRETDAAHGATTLHTVRPDDANRAREIAGRALGLLHAKK